MTMKTKLITLLLTTIVLFSCNHPQTRGDRMESKATEYIKRTTHPLKDYIIAAEHVESNDTNFLGYVGYRCAITEQYEVFKVVFVAVQGEDIVYVGPHEETAMRMLNI